MCVGLVDIDFRKQIFVHEVVVALRIVVRDGIIFIQVKGTDGLKINVTAAVHLGQNAVHADRRRTGSQPQYTVFVLFDLVCDKLCRRFGNLIIIITYD